MAGRFKRPTGSINPPGGPSRSSTEAVGSSAENLGQEARLACVFRRLDACEKEEKPVFSTEKKVCEAKMKWKFVCVFVIFILRVDARRIFEERHEEDVGSSRKDRGKPFSDGIKLFRVGRQNFLECNFHQQS